MTYAVYKPKAQLQCLLVREWAYDDRLQLTSFINMLANTHLLRLIRIFLLLKLLIPG
jgi:hypothetical protein